MPRPATGRIVEPDGQRQASYALRFTAHGKRRFVTLGKPENGWNRERAEAELRHVLADVERGIWKPEEPTPAPAAPEVEQTFREFATEWLRLGEPEWRPRTVDDYRWSLELHLLPFFADFPLSQIDAATVDRYKTSKLRQGEERQAAIDAGKPLRDRDGSVLRPLSPNAINKTLTRLAQVLETAVEYGGIDSNPARGKRRRVKATEPRRTWVEVEQLMALIDAADAFLRPVVATLAGAGLRVGEAVALDWRDVNLGAGTLTVRDSKTAAGQGREVDLPVGLREELATWRARSPRTEPGDPVFVSRARNGEHARQTARNVHARLKTAIGVANVALAEEGIEPIESASPHSLRRTFTSLHFARGEDPIYVAQQGGWADPAFPMRVYAKAVRRRERLTGAHLAAFDRAVEWAGNRQGSTETDADDPRAEIPLDATPRAAKP